MINPPKFRQMGASFLVSAMLSRRAIGYLPLVSKFLTPLLIITIANTAFTAFNYHISSRLLILIISRLMDRFKSRKVLAKWQSLRSAMIEISYAERDRENASSTRTDYQSNNQPTNQSNFIKFLYQTTNQRSPKITKLEE